MIAAILALALWQGEKLYCFGRVDSPLVTRRGAIVSANGYPDKVVWGVGDDVAEIVADAAPGQYGDVVVLDRKMPPLRESDFVLDLWQHPWAVARTARCQPFSPAHYAAMRPLWEMLADAGQKSLTVTLLPLPWNHQCHDGYGSMVGISRREDGSWNFDFSLFDEYVAFGKACGLGPFISAYTMCPWGYVHRFAGAGGEEAAVKMRPGSREYDSFWRAYLKAFSAHLAEKGWLEGTFIALDERSPEDVRAIVKLVRETAPGLKIHMAADRSWREFAELEIESFSEALQFVDADFRAWAAERRAKGQTTTFYVCCYPERPNTFIHSPRQEAFALGKTAHDFGLDGFLRWAYNSWPEDPDRDASFGNWPAGDTFLVYPDGSPSVRFLELRNGISAAVKARIAEKGSE